MEKFKDVTFGGLNFRINVPTAREGTMVLAIIASQRLLENYERVFDIIVGRCQYLRDVNGTAVPQEIYKNGRWLVPDLDMEQNTDLVMQLFDAAIAFLTDPTSRRADLEEASKQQPQA